MDRASWVEPGIWLKVTNVRHQGGSVFIQVEGDWKDEQPAWWPVKQGILKNDELAAFGAILESLDRKKPILARLTCCEAGEAKEFGLRVANSAFLGCDVLRLQFTDARSVL